MPRFTLGLIGTFYGRHENTEPLVNRIFGESTRIPDASWLMCETEDDRLVLETATSGKRCPGLRIVQLETPKENGRYTVIPYSNKINWALDSIDTDAIVYLDNGSMPSIEKFAVMMEALEAHPDWGAVYCGQRRTGFSEHDAPADEIVHDGYCAVNYTQVMHRLTDDRWPTDMSYALPNDIADGHFWRALHKTIGPFHPVDMGVLHDEHHMPSPQAQGL